MSQPATPRGRVMPLQEYLALPGELRAEYVDGAVVQHPPASFGHQKVCGRLTTLLQATASGTRQVVAAAGWQVAEDHVRIPDVMLVGAAPHGPLVTDPPQVAVEVLASTRTDDLVRKSAEYLHAGVEQFWVVDPRDRVIDIYANTSTGWHPLAQLTDQTPGADIQLPGGSTAHVDLHAILA